MPSGFFIWSETAAANGTADSSAPWPEGMSPSTINDSARAMMAVLRRWGSDISGAIVTTGTSTAFAVGSHSVFDSLAHLDGQTIAFSPHATSGGTCTLNVDGLGAKPLRSAPSAEIPPGTLVQGTPYLAVYNNTDGAFYLHGFFNNPYNVPIGSCIDFFGSTAPNSSFVLAYGQAISRTTYATLFSFFGTAYGAGDGTTTFNIPDCRGRVIAGLDNMGGSAAGRIGSVVTDSGTIVGTTIGSAGGSATHALATTEIPSHQHNVYLRDPTHSHSYTMPNSSGNTGGGGAFGNTPIGSTTAASSTGITIGSVSGTANDNQTAATGGGSAHALIQPTIIANKLIRII